MEERLKGLKKAMKNTTFEHLQFSEVHRQKVSDQIKQISPVALTEEILPLLVESKTGSELAELLHIRGEKSIRFNEGAVYTSLHLAEQNGALESFWTEGDKYYRLSKKGHKLLQKKHSSTATRFSLRQLFHEVTTDEH